MTPVAAMLLGSMGCIWVSRADRDLRWDADQDGVERPDDCDDTDPAISPEAEEVCDGLGVDEDCDDLVDDEDPSVVDATWCLDVDEDGSGDPATAVTSCAVPGPEWIADCEDCDDGDPFTSCEPTDTGECGAVFAVLETSEPVGEQGLTPFTTDGSASVGTELQYAFDWGDGSNEALGPSPTGEHVYSSSGWFAVRLTVQDRCDRTASAEQWVAVSAPGGLLRVSTGADEGDPEVFPPVSGYLGTGLSLREALALAQSLAGAQVVAFEAGVGSVATGPSMPGLTDAGGVLVGLGVVVDGAAGGTISVDGQGAVIAGIELAGFTDATNGAVHLVGSAAVADGITIRDSAVGLVVDGPGAVVRDVVVSGSTGAQVVLSAQAVLQGVDIADGSNVGVTVQSGGSGSSITLARIHGNGSTGVLVDRGADDVSILDATIVGNGGDGVLASGAPPVDGLDVRNVILAYNGGLGVSAKSQSFAAGAPAFDLWFANGGGDCSSCGSLGDGSLTVDPLFADPLNGDFTLLPGSPVVDAGSPETGVDRNGPTVGAWYGAGPDIGADEVR